jgi:hypothetical protein
VTVDEIIRAGRIESALRALVAFRGRVSQSPGEFMGGLRGDPEGLAAALFSGPVWTEAQEAIARTPTLTTEHLRIMRGMQPGGGYTLGALRCHGATRQRLSDLEAAGLVSFDEHWRLTDSGVAARSRIEPSPEVGAEGVFVRDV